MSLGPMEIGLIVLAVMLLFGYRKLPDASRSLGRSVRILRSEIGAAPVEGEVPGTTGTTSTG
ncbi:mttA/Hcf106 family protein [Blastococcus haudaquaticus]|uniref:MttA/Hcf106 family protein n=2 Tax=Blastococcus haudaquaticus TaxID=1938745 RepID=A0A286GXX1_9ACTN|nr:mttA/Hcf106 family protein [Blastococcus haudaquaticus]